MGRSGKPHRLREGVISRSGVFRRGGCEFTTSSDRVVAPIAGRQARHDSVAMCLLRKDVVHVLPQRREHRIARNRRLFRLVGIFTLFWWLAGWLLL